MYTRRQVLGALTWPAVMPAAAPVDPRRFAAALVAAAELAPPDGPPEQTATDEDFWFQVAGAFTPDRSLLNLNNGGVSPSPAVVQEAMKRHLDFSNTAPTWAMWRILRPQLETVRTRLADAFGCERETVAITRNASEGLQICQFGVELEPGDEVLTTNQDYPRMLATFQQRERREKIRLVDVSLPVPCEEPAQIVSRFEREITPRTRLILVCHVINLTGQILPVREVAALGRARGIPVIVDGAHAVANLNFRIDDIGADYYASSLHKWLFAPHGTGLLHVARDRIAGLWPLMAAEEALRDDIRKFEQIGTHPLANPLAISEALMFHEGLGAARKEARLLHLRDLWAKRLLEHDRVRLHTSLEPGFACGIATVEIDGIPSSRVGQWLWEKHRILTTNIEHAEFQGTRVSPSVYTTPLELDRFCEAMEQLITGKAQLPADSDS